MALSIQYTDHQAKRAILCIIALEFFFAFAYVVVHILFVDEQWGPLRPLFNLDGENSLPTWTSVIKLFAVGALLLLAARNNWQQEHVSNAALVIAAVIFIYLSADEQAQLHENLTYQSRRIGLADIAAIGPWGAWIYAYAALGLIGLALCWKHMHALWRHFRQVAAAGLAGAAMYFAGAVGFEIASFPFRQLADTHTIHLIMITLEELLEMLGVSIILYATLALANRLSVRPQARP